MRQSNDRKRRLGAVLAAGAAALATAVLPLPTATAGPLPASAASAAAVGFDHGPASHGSGAAKGPVGWDTYRHLDRVDELTTGVRTRQFSSFDRTGGNDDGFAGTHSCLRTTDTGCVIAERSGPGEIDSIWFTRDNGDVSATGTITVQLDGRTVLDARLQDVVDGKLGAPFVQPFVANADQSSGGVWIKVPMPYRESMRVTVQHNPLFYHVTYRTFPDAVGVATFDPSDTAQDVIDASRSWGSADPKPAVAGARTTTTPFRLAPGRTARLADLKGAGEISQLRLRVPQVVGPEPLTAIADDGRAHKGTSTFTVAVDPANQGVQLRRRFDANSARQVATVTVDGKDAGRWEATDDVAGVWSYQTLELPASLTAGKSHITVTNTFVSATIDWNEFHYWVDSVVGGKPVRTDELDVGPSAAGLASEKAHAYAITGQTWTGTPVQTDAPGPDDPAVLASNELLRDVYVRISFDGRKTVESPLGELFGSGLTEAPVSALFYAMDAGDGGWYSSWWPMPYAERATVELVNRSDRTIESGTAQVTAHAEPGLGRRLHGTDPTVGYFNATHHRGDTVAGQDWTFLDTAGRGKFVGVSHTMRGHITSGNLRDYLEGDERVYVDGSRSPALHGTGTEDFYESGWYFNRREFSSPFNGLSAMPTKTNGCAYQCDSPYRLMIADAVAFSSGLTFGIEHGPVDNEPAEYSSTAYWYGASTPAARTTDTIDVGDAADESAHAYSGSGAATTLTARFEGDHDDEPMTDDVASATGAVTFRMAVDPRASAVVLRRTSDQSAGWQSAAVSVDGRPAGTWLEPLDNATQRWLDDELTLPPALTEGKRRITVTLTPSDGAPAWSAASYQALSLGRALPDHRAPSRVTGLVATGTDGNAIRLAWDAASDDVGVHGYRVYASTRPGFRPDGRTLVGTSTLPSFTHRDLDLQQTWYYRVRAVDGSGNTGPVSGVVHATTGSTWRVEGESLLPAVAADALVEAQGNCCGVTWSGDRQLWFHGAKAGDAVTLRLDVPRAGTYDVSAVMTQAVDYAVAQVALDGKDLGDAVDNYRASGVGVTTRPLGSVQLSEGEHTLTLTAVGKNAKATSYMIGLDTVNLTLRGGSDVRVTPYTRTTSVVLGGDRKRIYDPSAGEDEAWYVNDHTFVRGADGTWHLFGITHAEPADPLDESFFAHATASSLTQAQYTKQPGVIHADLDLGEKHVWAPFVLEHDGTYFMYYSAGLDDDHETYQIRLATSTDLSTWTKRPDALFRDGFDARDPMVLRVGKQWVMYYTATSTPSGGNHEVAYRTSTDLVHWGAKHVAFTHPATGTSGGPTESPFVVHKDGWYYLFVCCQAGYDDTRVYKSRDPLHFSYDDAAGHVAEHAAEVVQDTDGRWYVSGAGWGAGGVYLRPLDWQGTEVTEGRTVTAPGYRLDVETSPRTQVRSMDVADGSGGFRRVLDDDYRGTSPYLGVGNFGNTDVTGAARAVRVDGSTLRLEDVPLGDEPASVDWTLDLGTNAFTSSADLHVTGALSAPVWEASFTVDGAGLRTGDDANPDRPGGDVHGFPAWTQSTGPDASVAARYQGGAFGTDNRFYAGSGAVVWQPLWQPGGRPVGIGTYPLGSLRLGASPIGGDDELGATLGG
ncbi:DUF2961 domain-containing protein [Luteimicrobium sp. NPDC057192]|uniref:DUF2961 domain-containing protein n=1 Tax=Luteimicrobium sp. NPDC057192 TaxID=3346042 RepID=UPI003637A892